MIVVKRDHVIIPLLSSRHHMNVTVLPRREYKINVWSRTRIPDRSALARLFPSALGLHLSLLVSASPDYGLIFT